MSGFVVFSSTVSAVSVVIVAVGVVVCVSSFA